MTAPSRVGKVSALAQGRGWQGYLTATIVVAAATGIAAGIFGRGELADVVMTYLFGIVVISMRFGFRASVFGAILSVLTIDFFFVPPYLTFIVRDFRHVGTFAVMLLIAVVIAGLTQRVRDQADGARKSERRISRLYAMSQELARTQGLTALTNVAGRHIETVFESRCVVFVADKAGGFLPMFASEGFDIGPEDRPVLDWVWAEGREAGFGTDAFADARGYYIPLVASGAARRLVGILAIFPAHPSPLADPEQRRLADGLATQMVMAIERGRLAEETERVRVEVETEQLRNALLSSVSHDLRTPLAVMTGAASTLVDEDASMAPSVRKELAQTLLEESERLGRLVRNLLDMTRLQSGAVHVKKEWQSVEEVVGAGFSRTEARLEKRQVTTHVPADLLAPFDAVLIEQVLVNLLENAAKYTPSETPIEVSVTRSDRELLIAIADRGPGIASGESSRIFEKFQRGASERASAGVGLGLAICRAIVAAHGGRIWVENREGGGAVFTFALPLEGEPLAGTLPEIGEKGV